MKALSEPLPPKDVEYTKDGDVSSYKEWVVMYKASAPVYWFLRNEATFTDYPKHFDHPPTLEEIKALVEPDPEEQQVGECEECHQEKPLEDLWINDDASQILCSECMNKKAKTVGKVVEEALKQKVRRVDLVLATQELTGLTYMPVQHLPFEQLESEIKKWTQKDILAGICVVFDDSSLEDVWLTTDFQKRPKPSIVETVEKHLRKMQQEQDHPTHPPPPQETQKEAEKPEKDEKPSKPIRQHGLAEWF
jgi:hypothetical protein